MQRMNSPSARLNQTSRQRRWLRSAVCTTPLIFAAGCASFPQLETSVQRTPAEVETSGDISGSQGPRAQNTASTRARQTLEIPGGRPSGQPARAGATAAEIDALVPDEMVDAVLAPQTIPQFVATVFGGVLKVPYTMSPDTATRTEVIAGGSGGSVSKRALFKLTQAALKQYGIEVYIDGNFVTVGGGSTTPVGGAEVVRDRQPRANAARVVQFFTVQTIDISVLQTLLQDVFPNLASVRITPEPASNSLIISGSGRDVAALVQVLRQIDQPRYAGSQVLRVEPIYLSTEALTTALTQVLGTEGYVVSAQPGLARAITILPFATSNQLLIFASDPILLERALFWVDSLDQPASLGDKASTFVYEVRQTDAQSLGQLAIGQAPQTTQIQRPVGVPGTPPAGSQNNGSGGSSNLTNSGGGNSSSPASTQGEFLGGRVITDPIGNRILFTGTANDYAQLRTLLTALDKPAPQVVIEVMIAEVTLTDATRLGIDFSGTSTRGDGTFTGGTEGRLGLGAGGALVTYVGSNIRANINAEASNSKVNVLQRPRLVARSGGTARFQVGTDVPIITSQRATDFQSGNGGTDILQSVQYRQTGVILEVKPVVYGDRVDITISQEISSAGEAPSSGIASPIILNRSLTTQLAIADGSTGVLGGLIGNNYTKTNRGVPFLKDIPIVGSAFQSNSVSGDRTELLILITPHIVRGTEDMTDFAETYSRDMNAAFQTGRGWSYTLTPWSAGRAFRGIGVDLPSAAPASERPPLFSRTAPQPVVIPVDVPAEPATTVPAKDVPPVTVNVPG